MAIGFGGAAFGGRFRLYSILSMVILLYGYCLSSETIQRSRAPREDQ